MAKFNTKNTSKTVNKEGFTSYKVDSFKQRLVTMVINSIIKGDMFYQTEKERLQEIETEFKNNVDKYQEFIAKTIIYTRTQANLRSITHFLNVLLTENVKGSSLVKNTIVRSALRPDDLTETVALWNTRHPNTMIPNQLRKGIKICLEDKFDAYQLKKYFGNGSVKVHNLIMLAHPTPKDKEQEKMFKDALEGKLPKIDTAQTVNAGTKGEDRAKMYKDMLKNRKLGIMALLKNLKNIIEANDNTLDTETLGMILEYITNKNVIKNSKLLPIRFYQAYKALNNIDMNIFVKKQLQDALETAFKYAGENIEIAKENERVAVLLDDSYSMEGTPFDNGVILTASLVSTLKPKNVIGYLWANSARRIKLDVNHPLRWVDRTRANGGGTNLGGSIEELIRTKTVVDKLIIFTDNQENYFTRYGNFKEALKTYRGISPNVKVLFWDLAGYNTGTPIKLSKDILEVAGYSDKMLEVVSKIWEDKDALIKEIENISL